MTREQAAPALYWRQIVRAGMPRITGDDEEFRAYIEHHLPGSTGLERYLLALGLLTFGILELGALSVVDVIVDNAPGAHHPARVLARAVDDLLPTGGDVLADPGATRRWLARNRPSLMWDPVAGVFRLTPA